MSDILDGAIQMMRSNPKATLGLAAVVAALSTLPSAVAQALVFDELFDVLLSGNTNGAVSLGFAQIAGFLFTTVLEFFAVTILTGMLTRVLGRSVFGGRITPAEAWELTRRQVPALLGVAALTTLIMLAPMAVLWGLMVAAILAGRLELFALILIGGIFGYLAYVLFFTVRFAFVAPAVVLERRGVIDALRRSWRLTLTGFWRVLGIVLLTFLITFVINIVIGIPFSITASGLAYALGPGGAAGAVTIVQAIGATVAAVVTYTLQAGVYGLLYADQRMRIEAFDLVLQSAAVDQQRLGWVPASADELWYPSNAAGPQGYGGT